jgi:hypothetical protein
MSGDQSSDDRDPVERLAEEFVERHRRGECPSPAEYVERHPQWAERIHTLFPALLQMEHHKPGVSEPGYSPEEACGAAAPLKQLGDYRIIREVGWGGMGVVYEAEQESLGRRVALKVLTSQGLRDSKLLLRFHREARAAARLHHTNIVPVFGVGESEGRHYRGAGARRGAQGAQAAERPVAGAASLRGPGGRPGSGSVPGSFQQRLRLDAEGLQLLLLR